MIIPHRRTRAALAFHKKIISSSILALLRMSAKTRRGDKVLALRCQAGWRGMLYTADALAAAQYDVSSITAVVGAGDRRGQKECAG
jgi:hypothetical protein